MMTSTVDSPLGIALDRLKNFLFEYKVVLLFGIVSLFAFHHSGMSTPMFFNEIFTRFGRNSVLVLSLLIPVMAGLGLNFGMVLGAMGGQLAIFLIVLWGGSGLSGMFAVFAVATPIAVLFGYLVGKLFNNMKGSEMIGGMVTNLFSNGLYQFLLLFVMGGVIPIANERIMTPTGVGVLNAINIGDTPVYMRQVIDDVPMLNILDVAFWVMLVFVAVLLIRRKINKEPIQIAGATGILRPLIAFVIIALAYLASFVIMPFHYFLYQDRLNGLMAADIFLGVMALLMVGRIVIHKFIDKKPGLPRKPITNLAGIAIAYAVTLLPPITLGLANVSIPVLTYLMIAGICVFITWLMGTKLGQSMRTVGHNRNVANAAGINVDRTRIIAVILSTLLAAYGQIIAIQNFGVMNTYSAHEFVGLYSVAALLIGGATVSKASVKHALMGVLLFHSFFVLAPLASANLIGSALIGEYVRMVVANAVIALALIMHAWQRVKARKTDDGTEGGTLTPPPTPPTPPPGGSKLSDSELSGATA